ncbi:hypothetical protein COT99_00040 [Candidatus Falkowbacteria bacterium CG10_big_fil_rev_8_21_14_0_10_43_10]|uniref:Methyltransferase FkbM domain-containing protein n=1 Tax=Candidatus Falkowbacteria bacterium CG10_big_fil_rev_8_21_14_0_10_43_10 TaxID=1974567 RepID=A0A2H0V375_9BACT|nr:MAG: hypothetical protein COT99_00040 [Candidatus Falkowbacteria bacterium CG10_big_fil_rev_8_21_14_0_10_43_10]
MLAKIFIKISQLYLNKINKSSKIRDFLTWPIASLILGKKYENVVKLKNGLKMKTDLGDILGRFVIFYGPKLNYFWEPQTTKLMEALARDAGQGIVAGAHIGYMALMAGKAMRREDSVLHSFEPVSYLYNIAKENFALNSDLGEMILNKKALSDKSGEVEMSVDTLRSAIIEDKSAVNTEKAEAVSIDDYAREMNIASLDFMLLDVEGHEPAVFSGMKNILARGKPRDIIFEYSQKVKGSFSDIDKYTEPLKPYGYRFYIIKDNYKLENIKKDWGRVEIFELEKNIDKFSEYSYFNVLATRRGEDKLRSLNIFLSSRVPRLRSG